MIIPPLPPRDDRPDGERGFVSLRDHLAAAALTGLARSIPESSVYHQDIVASQAYGLADAMLREREKSSVGVTEMGSVADRKSVATHGACAGPCSQPFDSAPTTSLTDDEIAAIRHAIVWMPPAYNPQHVTLRRLLERTNTNA